MDSQPWMYSSYGKGCFSNLFIGGPRENIYVADDYYLNVTGNGDYKCYHGLISIFYHVPSLSENLILVFQLTKTKKTVEFWSDRFIVKDLRLGMENISLGIWIQNMDFISFVILP